MFDTESIFTRSILTRIVRTVWSHFYLYKYTLASDLGLFYPSSAARTIDSGRRRIRPLYGANGYISILLEANRNGDL